MKYLLGIIAALSLIFGTLLFSSYNTSQDTTKASLPVVSSTIFPLTDIIKNVGKDVVEVKQILPDGANPHSYDPRPDDIRTVAESHAFYIIGHHLDAWATNLGTSNNTPVITIDKNIKLRAGADEHEDEYEIDPHYWLSIPNAQLIAGNIAVDLQHRFPNQSDRISQNLAAYNEQLVAADKEIRSMLGNLTNKNLVTFHDGLQYFAAEYGLTIIGTALPTNNTEPSPKYLGELRDTITKAGVKTLYTEPQFSIDPIAQFTKDEHLKTAELFTDVGSGDITSYILLMRHNAATISQNQ
jgi:ABC-type Zn uptake system ZnuABC Zn-binding protein ZnuA